MARRILLVASVFLFALIVAFPVQADKGAVGSVDHGELLPYDTQSSGDVPNSATTVDMREMATYLSTQYLARHKLIILHCCHSGAVFDQSSLLGTARPTSPFHERLDRALFQTPAFQAISASRKRQEAFDGPRVKRQEGTSSASVSDPKQPVGDSHSPFSYALLRALQTVPRRGGMKPITAGSLFRAMRVFLDARLLHNTRRSI